MASPFNRNVLPVNLCIRSNGETWRVLCSEAYLVRLPGGGVALRYLVQAGEASPPTRWIGSTAGSPLVETASEQPEAPNEATATHVTAKARARKRCNVAECTLQVQGRYIREPDALGMAGPRCKRHGARAYKCDIPGCSLDCRRRMQADAIGAGGRRCERHGATRTSAKRRLPGGASMRISPLVDVSDDDPIVVDSDVPEQGHQEQVDMEAVDADFDQQAPVSVDSQPQKEQARPLCEAMVYVSDCQGAAWVYGALMKKSWNEEDGHVCIELELREPGPHFRRLTESESFHAPTPDLADIEGAMHRASRRMCSSAGCSKRSQGKNTDGAPACIRHGSTRRRCDVEMCSKSAQGKKVMVPDGSYSYRCSSHGGSKTKCSIDGCSKQAQGGKTHRSANGGGAESRCREHSERR